MTDLSTNLVRHTVWNVLGWCLPLVLSLVAVPVIVSSVGITAYGVFALVSVLIGYVGVLNVPAAQSGVPLMAEAHAREDWTTLRGLTLASVALAVGSSLVGALILFFAAPILVRLFNVPAELYDESIASMKWGAVTFFLTGAAYGLSSVLVALRRLGLFNLLTTMARVLGTGFVIGAVALGYGLVGAMAGQTLAASLSIVVHCVVVAAVVGRLSDVRAFRLPAGVGRKLSAFSARLFAGHLAAVVGLQLDRGFIGILAGPSAVGYYSTATRLTDNAVGLLGSVGDALYPLSSAANARGQLSELRELYLQAAKLLAWGAALASTILIVTAGDLMTLWMGNDVAARATVPLALLAGTIYWRGPATIAHRVCNGLGRADVSMRISYATLASTAIPVVLLTPLYGIEGAAFGILVGTAPVAVTYDLVVQRRLLNQRKWRQSAAIYWKPGMAIAASFAVFWLVEADEPWLSFAARSLVVLALFCVTALVFEREDLRSLAAFLRRRLPRTQESG